MRPRPRARVLLLLLALIVPGCGKSERGPGDITTGPTPRFPDPKEGMKPHAPGLKNEVPANELDFVMGGLFQGLGSMERYEYPKAVDAFRRVHERAPGWIPGSVNLAIGLLNLTGVRAEEAKKAGRSGATTNFDEALGLLDEVLRQEPDNLHAHYCRGLILEFQGQLFEAHKDFVFVTERDPNDAHAWTKVGSTLTAPDDPRMPAGRDQAQQLIEIYTKAVERNPYLVTSLYKLQQAYGLAGDLDRQHELSDLWGRLNPEGNIAAPGEMIKSFYGDAGRYALIINPFPPAKGPSEVSPPPRFEPPAPLRVSLPDGDRWAMADDFVGPLAVVGRARARFGATVVTLDIDGDGRADLFLSAAVKTQGGIRDALLRNMGDGRFDDVSKAWGLSGSTGSLGAAAADFDADGKLDLFVTGVERNRLLRNVGTRFEDVSVKAGVAGAKMLSLTARWLDIDQDGDLDLYVVNYTDAEHSASAFNDSTVPGVVNTAFRNDGRPEPVQNRNRDTWAPKAVADDVSSKSGLSLKFTPWPDAGALTGKPARHTGVAVLDLDGDHDLDLVLSAEAGPLHAAINDRLGRFHVGAMTGQDDDPTADGLLVVDLDKDGRADLVTVRAAGRLSAWRNTTEPTASQTDISWQVWPTDAKRWTVAVANDFDLDTWPDLVGLPTIGRPSTLDWARNDGQRLGARPLAFGPDPSEGKRLTGFALADLVGDPLPDLLVIPDGLTPRLARNLGNGRHWLALDLGGRWKVYPDHMRTNPQAIGTHLAMEGQGLQVAYDHTTPQAGLGQSVGPVLLGLGKSPSADLVRLRWPDGVIQCELNKAADTLGPLAELNRKTGSCPVLFTWNGSRFICQGDFLGGGGLGYLVAPGLYGQPDRDESVAIASEDLVAVDGVYRLSITEPMDEVAYLDRVELVVVDRPPGVSVTVDERFSPNGARPSGAVRAWKTTVPPRRATDLAGRDVTETLRGRDRKTVDSFRRLRGWVGYAEEHGIVLDFGDRLSTYGPDTPLLLALAGWVEYPYSQTNYAASTAGVTLQPPVVERRNEDGTWTVIEPHAGYPAGLPRMTTLDLTGKLGGPRCVIRLKTNMECYWDQAFIAVRDLAAESSLRQTHRPVSRAVLGHRGYTREVSPDGREPFLYDYDHVDPAPLALMRGRLTRFGDVRPLLTDDDDRLCLVGPGDEVRLEFEAKGVPELAQGWTRSFLLKAVGYCKDADPFTATSDHVEPLPWRGMPAFPFSSDRVRRPEQPGYRTYLEEFQTRPAGGG